MAPIPSSSASPWAELPRCPALLRIVVDVSAHGSDAATIAGVRSTVRTVIPGIEDLSEMSREID